MSVHHEARATDEIIGAHRAAAEARRAAQEAALPGRLEYIESIVRQFPLAIPGTTRLDLISAGRQGDYPFTLEVQWQAALGTVSVVEELQKQGLRWPLGVHRLKETTYFVRRPGGDKVVESALSRHWQLPELASHVGTLLVGAQAYDTDQYTVVKVINEDGPGYHGLLVTRPEPDLREYIPPHGLLPLMTEDQLADYRAPVSRYTPGMAAS